ncbi:MAG: leucine-rich repeat domain-containing protein [Lachnospiraceae bacterium]|nr:leucine-rich repeat domain-containing protein [Lachnospiraceae bacterium]
MIIQDQFEIEDGILKAYTGPDAEIQIPEGVHTIGDGVFKGMSWILKVILPASIKKIGASAFKGCRKLKKIDFPDGLSEIGDHAFHRCHDLQEMIFPRSVTRVGSHAFLYCDGLKRIVLEGPDHFGKAVFSHNLSLEEVTLNRDVDDSNFSDEVFEGCILLKRIILSGNGEDGSIERAVYEIDNLVEAMDSHSPYPKIIKSIAKSVYHSLQIEDGVLQTFNINLRTISLPEGITSIGKACFFDKKGIVSIILPASLKEIRANAFLNCTGLEEITVQNEKLSLDEKAFRGCCNLKRVNLKGETYSLEDETMVEPVSSIRGQVLGDFYISGRILVRYVGNEEHVRIPKEVEIIGERCFFGNERLKMVTFPEKLSEIREQAFAGCVSLQNAIFSGRLKRVEREAFAECRKLLKCNLPDSVEYIGEYAFRRCFALKPFDPWPVNASIDPYAFYRTEQFVDQEVSGSEEGKGIINDTDGSVTSLYVNKESTTTLRLSGIKRIEKYAFSACPDLEEVDIDAPECVIEREAFSGCQNLRKVILRVKEISEGIFSYCRKLEEVSLSGISCLPERSFAGCYMLRKFEAGRLIKIGARCFDECRSLDTFDFSTVEFIGERAFERCDSLKTVKFDRTVCGFHAFADCASLECVEITEDTILKSGTFIGCTQVGTVIFNSQKYEFCRFSDSLNHVGNTYPTKVKEVIASVYSCFDIRDRKQLTGYSQDSVRITIPRDIEEVGQDVFRDHVRLKEINIPESVRIFGSHAFSMTAWLDRQREKTQTVIVNNVLIDGAACKGKVIIPDTVKRVSSWCFAGNIDITELVIPSEKIVIEALSFRNCLNLKKITDWNGQVFTLNNVSDLRRAGYPELIQRIFSECVNCFKLDENDNLTESTGNITDLTFPEGIRSIGESVYKDCHLLESIALSTDTAKIGKSAFENSKWLKLVTNAGAVESIGSMAFSGCQSLESIDLSDNLKEMGSRCFEHCGSLKEIKISDRLEKIPERAFFRCKSLGKLIIPKSVKVIETEAFAFCDGLEEVQLPKETQLSDGVFAFCDKAKICMY